MGTLAPMNLVVRLLDAWSYRLAQQKQQRRRERWLRRKAGPVAQAPIPYTPKPWRD